MERITLSPYKNNFVLKGGMLVAALMGLESRATMDIDTTVRFLPLTIAEATKVVTDVIAIDISDSVSFKIVKVENIMEEHEYPGIRFTLEATLDRMRQVIKIDLSTGDVLTPDAVIYDYQLMFEDRTISLWTYNLETLLGEKLETILSRGIVNTRMRDFYDIHVILEQIKERLNIQILKNAFLATSQKRGTANLILQATPILHEIRDSESMAKDWTRYCEDSFFVGNLSWKDVINSTERLVKLLQ